MIKMTIDSLRVGMMSPTQTQIGTPYVVLLKEKDADRYLPICIGQAEANDMAIRLRDEYTPRPLTHRFLHSVIDSLNASFVSAVITDIVDETIYAKVILEVSGEQKEIDCRPSDALTLALVSKSDSIYATEVIMKKAAIVLRGENEHAIGKQYDDKVTGVFSESAQEILENAQSIANRLQHIYIGTGHLLLSLIEDPNITELIGGLEIDLTHISEDIKARISFETGTEKIGLTAHTKNAVQLAVDQAKKM